MSLTHYTHLQGRYQHVRLILSDDPVLMICLSLLRPGYSIKLKLVVPCGFFCYGDVSCVHKEDMRIFGGQFLP